MSKSKLLASLLIGAAAGAVLGILLAPDKGSETRKKIAKKTNKLSEELKTKFSEAKETLKEKYDSIRSEANEIMEKEKDASKNFS